MGFLLISGLGGSQQASLRLHEESSPYALFDRPEKEQGCLEDFQTSSSFCLFQVPILSGLQFFHGGYKCLPTFALNRYYRQNAI